MKKHLARATAICFALLIPVLAFQCLIVTEVAGGISRSTDLASRGSARSMVTGLDGWETQELFTVGETFSGTTGAYNPTSAGDYAPPGLLDGLGAYELDADTVRLFANHEFSSRRGYDYLVSAGISGTFTLDGSRISYFDIDKSSYAVVDSGLAYHIIYDANGMIASDNSFLANNRIGFSRFCSGVLMEPTQFGNGRGLSDRIYFAGEENGGSSNPVGGAEWALDSATGNFWHIPAMGRGAWENISEIDTGTSSHVAFILADDTAPFDAGADPEAEAAPLFLYVGEKQVGDFLDQNGLRDGKLYVWVSDTNELTPLDFNGSGSLNGRWLEIDNSPVPGLASEDGSTGYDEYGYPTQRTLWLRAEAVGSFGFSRPEDSAVNPNDGREIVLASTGVDSYAVDPMSGNGADTFGTLYTVETDFSVITAPVASLTILYDGDADPDRSLRSPDNLEWADNGYIYVQEDEAEEDSLTGEPLFGVGAANPNEAGIVRVNPANGAVVRIANINRSVVLDGSIDPESDAVDRNAGAAGEWESSGILDVSILFDRFPGTLFLLDVQAHGIADQNSFNPTSRINDDDLVEGGQLLLIRAPAYKAHYPIMRNGQ